MGVKNLKDQLSLYLQYVKNGEKVIITEHNKIIAELSVPAKRDAISTFEQKLIQLNMEGKVILAKRNISLVKKPKITEKLDYESILNEIRSDRI
ncbi:MAG: type II toxin-antitoxin system prevent-host-death family antitoxin [Treponema sp.]|nr:type II toxin-antitoxin system prevent-host-death family antitoxin [Treponema sp.]